MKLDDRLFFLKTKFASLDVRSKIIGPSQPATFPASLKSCLVCVFESVICILRQNKVRENFCHDQFGMKIICVFI